MTTDKKAFTMRMHENNYDKLRILAKQNKRSMAMELEYVVEQYFKSYESKFGKIHSDGESVNSGNFVNNVQIGDNVSGINYFKAAFNGD